PSGPVELGMASLRSDVGRSTSARMPERKHLQNPTRRAIVNVVTSTSQGHATQAFHAFAARWRAHSGLRAENDQHFGNVVTKGIGSRGSVSCPPLCRPFDLVDGLRGDSDL